MWTIAGGWSIAAGHGHDCYASILCSGARATGVMSILASISALVNIGVLRRLLRSSGLPTDRARHEQMPPAQRGEQGITWSRALRNGAHLSSPSTPRNIPAQRSGLVDCCWAFLAWGPSSGDSA